MNSRIYAIGIRWEYERKLRDPRPLFKLGRGVDDAGRPYSGGSVWRTVADARRFIDEQGLIDTHQVYAVLADWERDAEQLPDEPFRRLVRPAQVVRLIESDE